MKVYQGTRTESGPAVVVDEDGQVHGLDPRRDLRNHNPAGFNWAGQGDSGSAQLALALAADVLGDDARALAVYQRLKWKLVGRLADQGWLLSEDRIRAVIETIEQERAHARQQPPHV